MAGRQRRLSSFASKGRRENLAAAFSKRYPPHEPARAIVLACILRHVGATHDDIAHRKLPRWYTSRRFTIARSVAAPRAQGSLVLHGRSSGSNPASVSARLVEGISSLRRETSRARRRTSPKPRVRNVKIASRVHRSEYAATLRFNPARIWRDNACA